MIVDNNFLNAEEIFEVKNSLLSVNFPWYLNEQTSPKQFGENGNQTIRKGFSDGIQFTHNFYQDNRPQSKYFDDVYYLFEKFCVSNNVTSRSIIRAKANFVPQNNKKIIAPAHVDYTFEHKVLIYYVNDSDGDTIIYNEKFNNNGVQGLTIANSISPISGKGILFDGLNYHSASFPTKNEYRVLINICFV